MVWGGGHFLRLLLKSKTKGVRGERGVDCALSWALILRTSGVGKMGCTGSSHELRNKGQYVQGYTHSTAISIYLTYLFIEAETTVLHGQSTK